MMMCPSSALLCSLAAIFVSKYQSRLKGNYKVAKSCTANGYFNAYGNAARKDKHDWVIHLGDYIYETGREGERATIPDHTLFTLHDYRSRHGQVRTHF
jgi:phosphodiesterase/alkaline phosphatase D-like protein